MCKKLQELTMEGIPIRADLSLSPKEIRQIVCEVVQSWTWEGRRLGRIELIRDGQGVHIYLYEQPFTQLVPIRITTEE